MSVPSFPALFRRSSRQAFSRPALLVRMEPLLLSINPELQIGVTAAAPFAEVLSTKYRRQRSGWWPNS